MISEGNDTIATELSRLGEIRMSSTHVRTVAAVYDVYDRRVYTFSDTAPLSRGTIKRSPPAARASCRELVAVGFMPAFLLLVQIAGSDMLDGIPSLNEVKHG